MTIAPVQTDLGSPLMCLTTEGVWQLQGILSTRGDCDKESPSGGRPAVFTDIMEMREWIGNTIGNY